MLERLSFIRQSSQCSAIVPVWACIVKPLYSHLSESRSRCTVWITVSSRASGPGVLVTAESRAIDEGVLGTAKPLPPGVLGTAEPLAVDEGVWGTAKLLPPGVLGTAEPWLCIEGCAELGSVQSTLSEPL
jgi:hypothetical protein